MYSILDLSGSLTPESLHVLESLSYADKKKHWITGDLTLRSSTAFERTIYTLFLKHSYCLRKILKIDLPESRTTLSEIKLSVLDLKLTEHVFLYNAAIKAFNKIAPRHSMEEVRGYFCDKLFSFITFPEKPIEDCFTKWAVLKFDEINTFISKFASDLGNLEGWKWVRNFEGKGGRTYLFPPPDQRKTAFFYGIKASDYVYPICHAGLVRSQITGFLMRQIKRYFHVNENENRIQRTHGILTGYEVKDGDVQEETSFREFFEEAFQVKRPLRTGAEVDPQLRRSYFKSHYWKVSNDPANRKIFICFANTGFMAIKKLFRHNPSLENVHVLMIPDGDWISCYQYQESLIEIIKKFKALPEPDESAVDEIIKGMKKEEFANMKSFEEDNILRQKIYKLHTELKNRLTIDIPTISFMQPYIYRAAFEYYLQFFKPVV